MVYDTEEPTLIAKMNHEMREIESMEIVGVLKYTAAGDKPAGFGVTLRCRASRDEGALVIKRWLNRVDEDASGLTFEEWDPASEADTSQEPVAMIINSSELSCLLYTSPSPRD